MSKTLKQFCEDISYPVAVEKLGFSEGMLRQWAGGWRTPDAANSVLIETKSDGEVTRKTLRPNDWQEIWPELATGSPTTHGAPVNA